MAVLSEREQREREKERALAFFSTAGGGNKRENYLNDGIKGLSCLIHMEKYMYLEIGVYASCTHVAKLWT